MHEKYPEILHELRHRVDGARAGQGGGDIGEEVAYYTTIKVDLAALRCSDRHPSKLHAMCHCEGLCYEMEQLQSFPFTDYSNSNGSL